MTMRKTLLLFCFIFFFLIAVSPKPAFAAAIQAWGSGYTLVGGGGPVSVPLSGCSTNHGYLIVAFVTNNGIDATAVTVSSTNIPVGSWHHGVNVAPDPNHDSAIWYAYSSSVSDTETVTVSGGNVWNASLMAQCYSGTTVTPQDQVSNNICGNGGPYVSSCAAGPVSPTQGGELVVAGMHMVGASVSVSGFTLATSSCASASMCMAYQIQTNPQSVNPTFSFNGGFIPVGGSDMTFFAQTPPTDYTVTGPGSGYVFTSSTSFTVTKGSGTFNGTQTITISDGSQGGTVTPSVGSPGVSSVTVTPANGASSFTFTYTPATTGTINLTFSSAGMSGNNPPSATYVSNPWLLSLSCASATGTINSASGACTMSLTGGTFDGSKNVTLSDSGEIPGGTFTPNVGSPFTSSGAVTPINGTTTFSFTYTPAGSVGARLLHFTNTFLATNPSDFTYTATSSDSCAFTAKAGTDASPANWNSASTWNVSGCTGGGHTTPTTGDTVSITGYHVLCSTGTCYVGTAPLNNTTYDLTITQNTSTWGVLEVASGATLWLTGNYKLNGSNGATSGGKLILDTGATFNHDNNNSATVAYRGSGGSQNNMNQIQVGTAGDACTITGAYTYSCPTNYKGVNTAGGLYPFLMAPPSMASVFSITAYGLGVKFCGSVSAPCIDIAESSLPISVDVEGGVFASTTPIGNSYGLTNSNGTFKWINNHEVSDLAGTFSVDAAPFMANQASCTISGNFFDATFAANQNDAFGSCHIKDNVFAGAQLMGANASHEWDFSGNATIQQQSQVLDIAAIGNIANNYWHQVMTSSGSAHMMTMGGADLLYTSNICDRSGGYVTEAHCLLTENVGAHTGKLLDNLITQAAGGDPSGMLFLQGNTAPSAAGMLMYFDHNGTNGQAYNGWFGSISHPTWYYQNNLAFGSFRGNIGWSPSSGAQNFLPDWIGGGAPTTLVNASTTWDWNNTYNYTASSLYPSSTFNGTAYQINSNTASPGSHETHADPKYIDVKRTGPAWASRIMGQANNATGLKAALWCQTESTCIGNMMTWIRQGYQPTNMALKGAAGDGYIVGVNGNLGTGYTPGTCTATTTIVSALDLGSGGSFGCTINSSGVPIITVTNPGSHYLISNPATVLIDDHNGHTSTGLTVKLNPMDIGPVPIYNFASVAQ